MKKLSLLFIISLNTLFVFAQKADSLQSKPAKPRNVNGTMMGPSKNMMDNIASSPEFTTLVSFIKATNLNDTFNGGPITVFAPTNKAFGNLPAGKLDTLLLPAHLTDLANLLKYHMINGQVTSEDMEARIKAGNGQATFITLSGGFLIATINANRNIVLTDEMGGQSVISKFDIQQSNGLLDIVTVVLTPKAKP